MIKTLSKARKQERVKFLIPRSVQDCIPIRRIWADGIFQVGHQFSKTWSFTDINYSIAGKDDKTAMFLDYCDLLNALASGASAKITLYNRRINKEEFERSVLLPLKEDGLDNYREEFNEMLRAQVTESNNSIVRERYLTISVVKRNIEEYQANNRTETANIASCEVIDDTHIKMMMAEPNSSTLESVGFFVYYMSPKALENPSSLDAATCGTGPFQLSEFENNAYAIYTKNENYWKEGLPYLDSVEVTLVTESSTANTAFQANEYDMYWVGLANPTILQQLDGAGIYVKEDNQNGMGVESLGLIPNSAIDGPWADARVRRALCYAIDVDAINAAFLMGMAQMTDQWAVPGSATYNDSLNHFTYDPEKAKSLLAEAGYADGFTTNIITISGMSDMLTAIANMLDEVGIHCNIQQVDGATNNQYMKDGTWEGLMLHFATIAPDLGLYMGRHLDKNGAYYAKGIQHPDKEMELLEEIRRCMDPDEKHKLEKELQAAIYDAEDGSCLFGRVLYVNKSSMYKYDYVIDDHATEAFTACWDLSACWLNK